MKRLLVVGNWKMYPETLPQASKLFKEIVAAVRSLRNVTAVVCPPFVYLSECRRLYRGKTLELGAQDVSSAKVGAHTGEISAAMLKNLGVSYVIVGHSERRARGETDDVINQKVIKALAQSLIPIVCIGEHERNSDGDYLHVLRTQLHAALSGVSGASLHDVVIAYEPIWAIGKTAADAMDPNTMHETGIYIRKLLTEKYSFDVARAVPILYGGSVERDNAEELLTRGEVNGFLVGHASLASDSFGSILKLVQARARMRS